MHIASLLADAAAYPIAGSMQLRWRTMTQAEREQEKEAHHGRWVTSAELPADMVNQTLVDHVINIVCQLSFKFVSFVIDDPRQLVRGNNVSSSGQP